MERAGFAEVYRPEPRYFPDGKPDVTVTAADLEGQDIALFQRQPEPHIAELFRVAQEMGVKVVFDVDDDLYSVPPNSPSYLSWGRDWRKIGGLGQLSNKVAQAVDGRSICTDEKVVEYEAKCHAAKQWTEQARANFDGIIRNLRLADLLTVSTRKLKQVYSKHRNDIVVLQNQVEQQDWEQAIADPHEKPDGEVWIGWAGSRTHWADLKEIARPIEEVLRRNPEARMVLVGFPEAQFLFKRQVITFDWMPLDEYRSVVAAFDVALAPSASIQFNEAKSDIRVLEAAICGVPVVASDTTYGETIREANCGFVAKTPQRWIRHVNRLVSNASLRSTMGRAGREYVTKKRTYDANAWRWAETYSKLLEEQTCNEQQFLSFYYPWL
jgi:glycosyltransferase involved in cell wall biosynthesis